MIRLGSVKQSTSEQRRRWTISLLAATVLNVAMIALVGLYQSPNSRSRQERRLRIVPMPPEPPIHKAIVNPSKPREIGPSSTERHHQIALATKSSHPSAARRAVAVPFKRVVQHVSVPVKALNQIVMPSEQVASNVEPVVQPPATPLPVAPAALAAIPSPSPQSASEAIVPSASDATNNQPGGGQTGAATGVGSGNVGDHVGDGVSDGSGNGNGAGGGPFGVGEAGGGIPRHVVYVMDVSPSMVSRIARARREMRKALLSLGQGESFDVLVFGDHPLKFARMLVPATSQNIDTADHFLETADFIPGTNLEAAMVTALTIPGINEVILITDGVPTEGQTDFDKLARLIRDRNRSHARIDTVGLVGKNPDGTDDSFEATRLLQTIAKESGGDAIIVPLGVAAP